MPGANTVAELAVVVSADTSPAESKLSSFGSGLGSMLGVGVAAAGAAVAAGVAVGVKAAGDLEQAVANISTIKPEIDTTAVFGALNEMSTRIPQTSAQLGESLYNVFSSLDVNAEQGLALVEKFAQGAVGAGTSAETFGTAAMGVMNAYGLSVKDADHISDVFFNTVNKGVITGEELASSLGPVTQSAKSAGVGLDELGAMIAAVTKEGGPAAQNVNNLNNFLQKITTKEAQNQINALGVATKTATGEFRPTTDVLEDLKVKLGGMTESARANALQAIFPDAQARIGAQTLLSQLDLVKSATEENRTSSGAAAAAYETMSQTFNSQSALLMNGLMAILTTIGAMLLPVITPLITAFATSLPGAFQAAQAAIGPVAEQIAAVLVPAFDAVMAALPTVIGLIQDLFDIFMGGDSFDAAAEALDSVFGPAVTDMILDFVAIAGDAFRAVADFALQHVGTIVAFFQENMPLILQTVQTVLEAVAAFWDEHGANIVTIVQSAWEIVTTVISGALDILLSTLKIAMQVINGDWAGAWETLTGLVERTMERLGTIISAAFDGFLAYIDSATGGMLTSITTWMDDTSTAISDGMTAVETTISDGWEAIKSAVAGILPTIISAIMTVWNALPEDIRADLVLIASHIASSAATWVQNLVTAGSNMLTAVSTALGNMVTAVTTWASSTFLAPITALVGTASAAMTSVGAGMLSAITGPIGQVVSAITGLGSSIMQALNGLIGSAGSAASSIGSAIVEGIRGAVMAGAQALANAAATIVRNALQAAKNAVGIDSPSKVFAAEVGKPIVQGVMQGLDSMSRPLNSALSGLISPPTMSRPAYGMAGAGGGNTYITLDARGAQVYDGSQFEDMLVSALGQAHRGGRITQVTL